MKKKNKDILADDALINEISEEVKKDLAIAYPKDTAAGMFDAECPLSTDYVIPKPFDIRVVPRVARKVAAAAMKTGVARIAIDDLDAYEASVMLRIKKSQGK